MISVSVRFRAYARALRERIATRLHPALHRDREGDVHIRATRVGSGAALIQGKPRAFLALVPARGEMLHVPLPDRAIRELPAQLQAGRADARQLARDIQTDGGGPPDDADDKSESETTHIPIREADSDDQEGGDG